MSSASSCWLLDWQLPRESKSSLSGQKLNFLSEKNQVRGGKKEKKIRKEKNVERKLARQTPHLNMKLRHAWGLQPDKEPEKCSSAE